jgi:hypothetical protein
MDIDATRALIPVQFTKPPLLAIERKGANRHHDLLPSVIYRQRAKDNVYSLLGERHGALIKGKTVDIYV